MKIIKFILLALIFVSCHSLKKSTATKEETKKETSQSQTTEERQTVKEQNNLVTRQETETTVTEYGPDETNPGPEGEKATTPESKPENKPGIIKRITTTRTITTTEDRGKKESQNQRQSKSDLKAEEQSQSQTKQSEKPAPDPYRWRYLLGILSIFVALGFILYRKRAKIKALLGPIFKRL